MPLVALVILFLLVRMAASTFRKVGPNEALIIFGAGGTKVVKGGGAFIMPMLQRSIPLSLELLTYDVAPEQDLYTSQGVAIRVEAVAQLKVKSDRDYILTAAEQFLSKTPEEKDAAIKNVLEGHLRAIVGRLTVENIVKDPDQVTSQMLATTAEDMSKLGMEVVTFTLKKVKDEQDYIANMGLPDVARIKREAEIAQAQATRDIQIKTAEALQEAAVARAIAAQTQVEAETASETRQAEVNRDLEVKRAEYDATIRRQRAMAEKAGEVAANEAQQQVMLAQIGISQVEKTEMMKVQELQIQLREKELQATVVKVAEAQRRQVEIGADAERQKRLLEAQGQAEALTVQGRAEADVIRMRGEAEASAIRARGEAEAEAMRLKADAYQQYSQAAVLDKMLSALPGMTQALADALGNVDKLTIVSTGDGNGTHGGLSNLTGDIARITAQVPQLLEGITGVSLQEMLRGLQGITPTAPSAPTPTVIEVRPSSAPGGNGVSSGKE